MTGNERESVARVSLTGPESGVDCSSVSASTAAPIAICPEQSCILSVHGRRTLLLSLNSLSFVTFTHLPTSSIFRMADAMDVDAPAAGASKVAKAKAGGGKEGAERFQVKKVSPRRPHHRPRRP